MYAGESHERSIFVIRHGKIVWSYDDPAGKGEISDAVMLSNGNILFTHQFGVTEITPEKKVVWNYDAPADHEIHTAVPIGKDHVLFIVNGNPAAVHVVNILITDRIGVREVTRRGDSTWTFGPADAPTFRFASLQQAWRLSNGDTVVNNWVNEWNSTAGNRLGTLQAMELTPAKKVVWVLQSWTRPAVLGPATTIQFLDEPSAPEDVHFGEIR